MFGMLGWFGRRPLDWDAVLGTLDGLDAPWVEVGSEQAWRMASFDVGGRACRAAVGCSLTDAGSVGLLRFDAIDVRSFSADEVEAMLTTLNRWHAARRFPTVAVEADPNDPEQYRLRAHWSAPIGDDLAVVGPLVGLALQSLAELWAFLAEAGICGAEPPWAEADRGLVALDGFLREAAEDPGA